jgi:hypothetical protein
MSNHPIKIHHVSSKKDLKKFIAFPFRLYEGSKYWCPPLYFDEYNTLIKEKNPAFDFCEAEYWIAYRGDEPVGRIAGIINHRANETWKEKLARFGWIDFVDDREVSAALIGTVSKWAKEKGMDGIHGPLGFSDMDPEGMLISGFGEPANMSAIYNYPYYAEHMIALGFEKANDWVQYKMEVPASVPDKVVRTAALVSEKYGLTTLEGRSLKVLKKYAGRMFSMQNFAFEKLYGFVALTPKQIEVYTKMYFGFIRSEFVSFVLDPNDDIVAFGISIPSLTFALQKARGRIFPFGIIHILRALRKNETVTMYLVGVRPDYQGRGALALVYNDLTKAYIKHGFKHAVTHPQMEENLKALSIWKNYEGRQHITRRCWIKRVQ